VSEEILAGIISYSGLWVFAQPPWYIARYVAIPVHFLHPGLRQLLVAAMIIDLYGSLSQSAVILSRILISFLHPKGQQFTSLGSL
jgi:hypothetical protein